MSKRRVAVALLSIASVTWGAGCGSDGLPTAPIIPSGGGSPATMPGAGAGGAGAGAPSTLPSAGSAAPSAGAAGSSPGAGGAGGAVTSGGGAAGAAGASMMSGGAGAAGGGSVTPPAKGNSAGCGMDAPGTDSPSNFVKHDIEVTEPMDQTFITAHPVPAGKVYNWTHRNYFMRLPKDYDKSKPYQLSIGGSGCGGSETVGSEGGYALLPGGNTQEIQIALSYVTATSACFSDDAVNPPDLQYFDAVIADVESKLCIDKSKVFVHGYSSGAWETYMLGCARAGVVRGIFTSQGGERLSRPACSAPIAALLSAGADPSNDNPIGPLDPTSGTAKALDSLGSAVARDEILKRNGCTSTQTQTWAGSNLCQQYKDCPAAYPVIWCPINGGHEYASALATPAETLFQGLPAAP